MKIIITGALGHIGSYLVENISKIKKLKHVYLIDNFLTNKYHVLFNIKKKKPSLSFFSIDLTKTNSLKKFKNIDVIVHLASITDAENSFKIKDEIYKNNLGCFKNVVNYCITNSTKLIHISSTSVYGAQKSIVDENSKFLKPQSPYAQVKFMEENILKKKSNFLNYNSYRFATIAGVSSGMRFHTAVNKFCLNAFLGKPIPVWRTALNQFRPYLSLGDAFKLIQFTLENDFYKNDIYNVLSDNYTVKSIINMIKRYKKNLRIKFVDSQIMNQQSYRVSKKKIMSEKINLNTKIEKDIKYTMKLFRNFKNEV